MKCDAYTENEKTYLIIGSLFLPDVYNSQFKLEKLCVSKPDASKLNFESDAS